MAGKPAERDGVEAQRNLSNRRAWPAFQTLLKGAVQGGQHQTTGLGRSEVSADLDDDSLGGPEGLEAGGEGWGEREADRWNSEVAFYWEGQQRSETLVRPVWRAQRGQGRVNVPQGRLGIDDAGQKGRLCKDTVLLIIWDIHIYLFKCVIYIYTHTHTAQFVRISAPQPGTEALQALGSESRVPTTGPLGNSLYAFIYIVYFT